MDLAIHSLIGLVVIFTLMLFLFDGQRLADVKRDIYQSSRAANQNSLLELKQAVINDEVLTDGQMIEHWIINYALQTGTAVEKIKISFLALNTEPQYYLVAIEGSDEYRFFAGDAASFFINGALVVKDE